MDYNRDEIRKKYKDLFEYSLDLIYVCDLTGNFLDANEIALMALGYNREEVLNLSFKDLVSGEQLLEALNVVKELIKTGRQLKPGEYKLRTKEGDDLYIQIYAIPLKKNRVIYAILGIATNITERKIAELKLKESEERYRNMVNNLDIGYYNIGLDGTIHYQNPASKKIAGFDDYNLIGKSSFDFWQNPEEREEYLEELKKNGFIKNFIVHGKKKDGTKIVVQVNAHTIKDAKDNPILIEGTLDDITDKFQLEKKLKESEKKYRQLFEETPFAIILLNLDGIIIDCNPTTKKLLGYDKEELIGRNYINTSVIHSKYLKITELLFNNFFKGKSVHSLDLEVYRKNNKLIWVQLRGSIIRIGDKQYMELLLYDISKQKKAEFLIKEQIIKLKELDEIRKNLIIRVSHELKTPLVSVCGGAELLLDQFGAELGKDAKEIVRLIEKGGNRLKNLVKRLLDISRLEENKLKLEKTKSDLSESITECINEMTYTIRKRKLNIDLDIPTNLYLEIDRMRIEQVINNLLSNAIKNTPPEGRITICLRKIGDCVEFTVRDTGVGFTKKEMEILFTRFGKIERYGQGLDDTDIQGSGLGLFISRELVKLHGGVIQAESPGRNKGSTFTVKLPLK